MTSLSSDDDQPSLKLGTTRHTLRRILPFAGPSWKALPVAFILMLLLASAQIALPQLIKLAIDGPLSPQNSQSLVKSTHALHVLAFQFLGFLALGFITSYTSALVLQHVGQNLVYHLRQELFTKLHRLPMSTFDKNAVGRIVSRVVNDSNALSELFTSVLAPSLSDLLMMAGILIVLLISDPILCAIVFVFCPLLIGITIWFRSRSAPLYKVQRQILAIINGFLAEVLEGLSTVKGFGGQSFLRARFTQLNTDCLDNEMALIGKVAIFRSSFSVAPIVATGLLLTVGGLSVVHQVTTIGTLVSSLLYVRLLFSPLQELAERYNILIRATVASERVLTILDSTPEPTGNTLPSRHQTLAFQNVNYFYSPDKPVLRGVSFKVNPGETLAIVGPTGSGKSTIVSLIMGFYHLDPQAGHTGSITYGNDALADLSLEAWRRRLAYVSQDLFLFKATVFDNLKLYEELSENEVRYALKQVGALSFLEALPSGVHTLIGERGHGLSTGQRQLLALARAIAFNPDILILDEATAHIDSQTEAQLDELLDELLPGRQAIIIAHRLATVRRADRILVVRDGYVSESGNHEELMALKGLYAAMVSKAEELTPPNAGQRMNKGAAS